MNTAITLTPQLPFYLSNCHSTLQVDSEESVNDIPAEKKHASLLGNDRIASPNESPERAVIRMFAEFVDIQETILGYLQKDMEMHVATIKEMTEAARAVSHIWASEKDPVATDFDVLINIDIRSPIGRGGNAGHPAPTEMPLKDLLVEYGIFKKGEALPVDKKAITALKDSIEARNTNMSSTTQLQQLDLTKVTTSREQSFAMMSGLSRQLIETLNNVIKRLV